MNPAPTLLNEWVTNQAFWGFIGVAAFAGLIYCTTEFLKAWHAEAAKLDKVLAPHVVNWCGTHGHAYAFVWRCAHCGHQPSEQVYDQELAPGTDLGRWNEELS